MERTFAEKMIDLKNGKSVVFDEYHNAKEMKSIFETIKQEIPTAWVTRSPSTNRWTVRAG